MTSTLPTSPSFTFVMTMVSVILSLGLTHLVSGNVQLFKAGREVRFSYVHTAWQVVAYLMFLDLWLSLWSLRTEVHWRLVDLVVVQAGAILLYVYAVLLTPPTTGDVDARTYHLENRKRFFTVGIIYFLWGAWANVYLLPYNFNVADLISIVPMITFMAIAWISPNPWVQRAAATAALIDMAIYFYLFFNDI